jgi:hypothetical protein
MRGHGQVDPIIVGDVVRWELRDAPGGARTLKRDARGVADGWGRGKFK